MLPNAAEMILGSIKKVLKSVTFRIMISAATPGMYVTFLTVMSQKIMMHIMVYSGQRNK